MYINLADMSKTVDQNPGYHEYYASVKVVLSKSSLLSIYCILTSPYRRQNTRDVDFPIPPKLVSLCVYVGMSV